jgi:hypothetical protein
VDASWYRSGQGGAIPQASPKSAQRRATQQSAFHDFHSGHLPKVLLCGKRGVRRCYICSGCSGALQLFLQPHFLQEGSCLGHKLGFKEGGRMRALALGLTCALAFTLAACDNQGPKGDPGPPGEQGSAGPPGALHIVRTTCDERSCVAKCADDEIAISAWCGTARNPTNFPTERSATCRGRSETNNPLVAVCAKTAGP